MQKADPIQDLALKYLVLSFTLFIFAAIVALILKIVQLLSLTSLPLVHSFYGRALTMHGLLMMSAFLPPVFHAGFGYLISGQKYGQERRRYFVEIGTAGFLLHATGIIAVLLGMFNGKFSSGWMVSWSQIKVAGVPGILFFSGLLLLQLSRITDSLNILALLLTRERRSELVKSPFGLALMVVSCVYLISSLIVPLLVFGNQLNPGWVNLYNFFLRPSVYLMAPLGLALILEIVSKHHPLTKVIFNRLKICLISIGLLAVLKVIFTILSYFHLNSNLALYSDWLMGLLSVPLLGLSVLVLQAWPWQAWKCSALSAMMRLILFMLLVGTITGLYHLMTASGQVERSTYLLVGHFHTVLFATNLIAAVVGVLHLSSKHTLNMQVRMFIGGTLLFIFSLYVMGWLRVYRHQSQILITDSAWLFGFISLLGGAVIVIAIACILFVFCKTLSSSLK